MPTPRFRFGRFTLLAAERRLLRDDGDVAIGPRAFDVLVALVERAGRLVSKDELLTSVWRELVVEEANLHVQVSQLRKVIGAEAIATIPGQGYKFTAPVAALSESLAHAPASAPAHGVPLRRLSIIVLPFVESGAAPGHEHLADAITDDLTAQLSKISGSYVVASRTASAYKREPFDLRALALELGVRYALQGRVERLPGGVEMHMRLTDASTGAVVWADAVVVEAADAVQVRRELVARASSMLTLELLKVEARRSAAEPVQHPEAADLLVQAGSIALTARSAAHFVAAQRLIERAFEIEPHNQRLRAYRARVLVTLATAWPGRDVDAQIAQAERDINAALAQDSMDAQFHCTLSRVRQQQLRIGAAITAVEQALELNPNLSEAVGWRGSLLVYNGQTERAFEPLQRALTLAPRDPHRWGPQCWLGKAHLFCGRYDEAIPWLEKSVAMFPFWAAHAMLVAANAHLGRVDETEAALQALREQVPDLAEQSKALRLSDHPVYRQQRRDHYASGLLKAGAIDDLAAFC